jgi:uncharacterized membrane protein YeaQ/YmgE (transglycosylase-associated protein family)
VNLFMTIVVGAIIGWLASTRMKTDGQMSVAAIVIAGVIGSYLGIFIAGALGIGGTGAIAGGIAAIAGAALLITVLDRTGMFEKMFA